MNNRPTAYFDEVALEVWDYFGIDVHPNTIGNVLKEAGWTRKVCRQRAAQMNKDLRALWAAKSMQWSRQQLVFVDECARSEKNGYRKYGWAPTGVSPMELKQTKYSDRFSVLPALTVNGYLPNSTLVIKGGVSKAVFIWWLEQKILPQLEPGYHILVMDNASIHHSPEIQQLFSEFEIQCEYLPLYSPDFNPIELTFNVLKSWLQKHIEEAEWYPDFGAFIYASISKVVGVDCEKYFEACGYM